MSEIDDDPKVLKQGFRVQLSWEYLAGGDRAGRYVEHKRSRVWLASRKAFGWFFHRINRFGLKHGFIEHDPCYECGGALEVTTETKKGEWVFDDRP